MQIFTPTENDYKYFTEHNITNLYIYLFNVKWSEKIIPSAEITKVEWLSKNDFDNKKYRLSPTLEKIVIDLIRENLIK